MKEAQEQEQECQALERIIANPEQLQKQSELKARLDALKAEKQQQEEQHREGKAMLEQVLFPERSRSWSRMAAACFFVFPSVRAPGDAGERGRLPWRSPRCSGSTRPCSRGCRRPMWKRRERLRGPQRCAAPPSAGSE